MPELIDKWKLLNTLCKECGHCKNMEEAEQGSAKPCSVHRIISEQPTIEPEVRRGRIIEGRYPNENKCSECGKMFRDDIGFIIQDDDGVFHYPKRCPECGCYWDGGADNG